jgi:hypothetical protein
MARTPNDDRSDSMNPNNDAYDASESNRLNQIGASDDDDDDYASPRRTFGSSIWGYSQPAKPAASPQEVVLEIVVKQPVHVPGLYMTIVSNDKKRRLIKVDAQTIEEAVGHAATVWDTKPVAFVALYDKENVYLEQSRSIPFSADVLKAILALEELEALIDYAADMTKRARISLNSASDSAYRQKPPPHLLEAYGGYYSALQGLRTERSERIEELRAKGCVVTDETVRELAQEGLLTQAADAGAQWVRDFQSGKARTDPMMALHRPERILDVKI